MQQETIRENQLELKSQLQLLADTEKYLRLIEERNREIERERAEKKGRKTLENFGEKHTVIKPEIKINEEYFRKAGIPFEKEEEKQTIEEQEIMQPLEDEGVIESTLKKAAEDIQQLFTEDKNLEKNTKKAEQQQAGQENSIRQEKTAVSETEEVSGQSKANQEHAAEETGKQAAADQTDDEREAAGERIDRSERPASRQSSENTTDTAGQSVQEVAETAEIKVNLDAEYFRQKNEETEESMKQSHNEKLSLLDRLMGKKKTLL